MQVQLGHVSVSTLVFLFKFLVLFSYRNNRIIEFNNLHLNFIQITDARMSILFGPSFIVYSLALRLVLDCLNRANEDSFFYAVILLRV